ncbi:RNA-directed DNA polymerase from mobile element jockey-like [Brachionus plicatilis]|uniref:RNA-directed DNA polymerase from mobile element jockey-like n=1 Tax=Brachionus plicatilis TaxID=10195 RepID=A0A3M7QZ24_BRAPC|nr:RNA-directed DNA polymerase from mobile element jockey-like [Brachionus plicatilis]
MCSTGLSRSSKPQPAGGVYHQTSDRQHWSINPVGQNLLSSVKDYARIISTFKDIEVEPKIKNNKTNKINETNISYLYSNPTSLRNKIPELLCRIEDNRPHVMCFSETWFNDQNTQQIEGYKLYYRNRTQAIHGAVCIYVENGVKSFENKENEFTNESIEQIWNFVDRNLVSGVMICGDFNLPEVTWDEDFIPFNSIRDFNSAENGMIEALKDAFFVQNVNFPLSRDLKRRTKPKWLNNNDIKDKIKTKNKLWFECKQSNFQNKNLWIKYKIARNECSKVIDKAVRVFEYSLAKQAKTKPKLIYNYINGKKTIRGGLDTIKVGDELVTDRKAIVGTMNNYFKSIFNLYNSTEDEIHFPTRTEATLLIDPFVIFKPQRIEKYLDKLNTEKSLAPDSIHPLVLNRCSKIVSNPLSLIFELL